jgi:2-oxoglutarate ferredoxin oxidoreductase subunit gamma
VNSSIITTSSSRNDIDVACVPANAIAEELGSAKMLNMAAVGAMLAKQPILSLEAVTQTLTDHLPPHKADLLEANHQVLKRGYESVTAVPA